MKRTTIYFESNSHFETYSSEITLNEIEQLKEIAKQYPNYRIFKNRKGNLQINYGRYQNEITL